jgi:hypothetical protein
MHAKDVPNVEDTGWHTEEFPIKYYFSLRTSKFRETEYKLNRKGFGFHVVHGSDTHACTHGASHRRGCEPAIGGGSQSHQSAAAVNARCSPARGSFCSAAAATVAIAD